MNFSWLFALPHVVFGIDLQQKFSARADETVAQCRRQILDAQRRAVVLVLQRLKRVGASRRTTPAGIPQLFRVFASRAAASPPACLCAGSVIAVAQKTRIASSRPGRLFLIASSAAPR